MASWVRKLNLLQKESNEEILDKAVEIYDKHINSYSIANENFEEIKFIVECNEFKNFKDEVDFACYVAKFVNKLDENIDSDALKHVDYEVDKIIEQLQEKIMDIACYSMFTEKESHIFGMRAANYLVQTRKNLLDFSLETINKYLDFHKFIDNYINITRHRLDTNFAEEKYQINLRKKMLQAQIDEIKNRLARYQKSKKIFDYKQMLKLANKNGYEHKRTSGDHLILQHKESQKIIVIPAHELGHGLMLEIQKQIRKNKIA